MVVTKLQFPYFEFFIFGFFTGPKKAIKGHFCLFFTHAGPKKAKNAKIKKDTVTLSEPLQRTSMPIFRSNEQFSREE